MVNITSRDIPGILGMSPYEDAWVVLETKIENKHQFFGNKFTEHGLKYERAGLIKYEQLTGNIIDYDQKNCRHPAAPWITGRLDGVTQNGCIVEMKCPWKRRTGELTLDDVPPHYWAQCQVYMNIIDAEVTHYVEYYVKSGSPTDGSSGSISCIPINRDREWWDLVIPKISDFNKEMNEWLEKGSLEDHPVRKAQLAWQTAFRI